MPPLSFDEFVATVRSSVQDFHDQWVNDEQEDAIKAPLFPPTLIVAGPGTGKTTALVLRVLKHILVDQQRPEQIIATTFTRKAAEVLRSRILSWGYATIQYGIGHANDNETRAWLESLDINRIKTGTLDSLSEQFIAETRPPGGITPTTIESLMARGLMLRFGLFQHGRFRNQQLTAFFNTIRPYYPGARALPDKVALAVEFADRVRHDQIDLQAYRSAGADQAQFAELIQDYLSLLEDRHYSDFARLEALLLEKIVQGQLEAITTTLGAVLVDEFQDTNYLQEQIYFELCRRSGASFTIVGDDDQSIYRFRGATVEIFADLSRRITRQLGQAWQPTRV